MSQILFLVERLIQDKYIQLISIEKVLIFCCQEVKMEMFAFGILEI